MRKFLLTNSFLRSSKSQKLCNNSGYSQQLVREAWTWCIFSFQYSWGQHYHRYIDCKIVFLFNTFHHTNMANHDNHTLLLLSVFLRATGCNWECYIPEENCNFVFHSFFLDTAMIYFVVHRFACRIVMKIMLLWKKGILWISVNHSFSRTAKPKKHQNYFFKDGYLRNHHIITQTCAWYCSIIVGFLRTKGKEHWTDISYSTVYLRIITIYQRNNTQWFLFWRFLEKNHSRGMEFNSNL